MRTPRKRASRMNFSTFALLSAIVYKNLLYVLTRHDELLTVPESRVHGLIRELPAPQLPISGRAGPQRSCTTRRKRDRRVRSRSMHKPCLRSVTQTAGPMETRINRTDTFKKTCTVR